MVIVRNALAITAKVFDAAKRVVTYIGHIALAVGRWLMNRGPLVAFSALLGLTAWGFYREHALRNAKATSNEVIPTTIVLNGKTGTIIVTENVTVPSLINLGNSVTIQATLTNRGTVNVPHDVTIKPRLQCIDCTVLPASVMQELLLAPE